MQIASFDVDDDDVASDFIVDNAEKIPIVIKTQTCTQVVEKVVVKPKHKGGRPATKAPKTIVEMAIKKFEEERKKDINVSPKDIATWTVYEAIRMGFEIDQSSIGAITKQLQIKFKGLLSRKTPKKNAYGGR